MKTALLILALATAAIAAEPYEVLPGMWTCDAGYVIKQGRCISQRDLTAARMEVSEVPSAGEGSRQRRSCPSGGCAAPQVRQPTVIETFTRHGDQGSIGRLPSGRVTSSTTVIY